MRVGLARFAVLCASLLALATPSSAQVFTGRIDVTVTDTTGAILPGATVEVTGPQTATGAADTKGEAHFLNLAPGLYTAQVSGVGNTTGVCLVEVYEVP